VAAPYLDDHVTTSIRGEQMTDTIRDQRFLLASPSGVSVLLSTWGANIVAVSVPDRNGRFEDVVLGFDTPAEYLANAGVFFGCTVGRVANRIAKARFTLDGVEYKLAVNNGPNHLHGGEKRSFDKVEWVGRHVASADGDSVEFRYVSPDGEEGYPGTLDTRVVYTLTPTDELIVEYFATTDQRTPVNLTNHTYWNLAGAGSATVLDQELHADADRFTPADEELIPTGKIQSVEGTPLDFRTSARLGDRIAAYDGTGAAGYDHNLVFRSGRSLTEPAVALRDPASGRVLQILTSQPCVQLYTGNYQGDTTGKGGKHYGRRSGVCLEPQVIPDSVNHPEWGPIFLDPGKEYRHAIVYRFRTDRKG
jgi:aldose 1-epimerase